MKKWDPFFLEFMFAPRFDTHTHAHSQTRNMFACHRHVSLFIFFGIEYYKENSIAHCVMHSRYFCWCCCIFSPHFSLCCLLLGIFFVCRTLNKIKHVIWEQRSDRNNKCCDHIWPKMHIIIALKSENRAPRIQFQPAFTQGTRKKKTAIQRIFVSSLFTHARVCALHTFCDGNIVAFFFVMKISSFTISNTIWNCRRRHNSSSVLVIMGGFIDGYSIMISKTRPN